MSSLLSTLGNYLHSLNPSLLAIPPEQEGDDKDLCYLGPNGEEDSGVTYCGDLDFGMRPNVGSWYLSPEQHIVEGVLALLFFGPILYAIQSQTISSTTRTVQHKIKHPFGMKPITLFCFTMILCYKYYGHHNKIYYMVMPCNMKWILAMIICFVPKESVKIIALELYCSYIVLAIIAITMPDTKDTVLFGEFYFFFFNHALLLLIPILYIRNGSITMVNTSFTNHFYWWLISCCYFAIFYFPIVSFLGVLSGLNLNYMMHPPPNQDFVLGKYYRWHSSGLMSFMFAISRILLYVVEKIVFQIFPPAPATVTKPKQT